MTPLLQVLKTELRFLLFLPMRADFKRFGAWYLGFGLVCTWLAGIGRYWDNPRAEWWQWLGFGSLMYVVILASLLWLIILPLKPRNWQYKSVLIFIMLTSPLAFLYAIPVERFYTLDTARSINVVFLAVVALWRVLLWILYLKRSAGMGIITAIVAGLLPLVLIVTALSILNLDHVVFRLMGGLGEDERSANDTAYFVLWLITIYSLMAAPVLAIGYGALIWLRRHAKAVKWV